MRDYSKKSPEDGLTTIAEGGKTREKEFLALLNNKTAGKEQVAKVTKFKTFNFERRTSTKYSFPLCHFDGYNLWLLKPTHLNRGRGIHVFRDLDTMHKLIREYCQGKDEEVKVAKKAPPAEASPEEETLDAEVPEPAKKGGAKKKSTAYKIKHNTFIIQKYIERPLLICGRKFDIRVWVLVDQEHDIHIFKEGYLRTSSSEFRVDLQNIDDQYVHLTNNAVQKYSEHYGQFEDGN